MPPLLFAVLIIFLFLICVSILVIALAALLYVIQRTFQIEIPTIKTDDRDLQMLITQLVLEKDDTIIDLGSGTGSTVFAFEKYTPATVIGYESGIVPFVISLIKKKSLKSTVKIVRKDFLRADLEATVIYAYLSDRMMKKLFPLVQKAMNDGRVSTIISCDFPLPDVQAKIVQGSVHTFYIYENLPVAALN